MRLILYLLFALFVGPAQAQPASEKIPPAQPASCAKAPCSSATSVVMVSIQTDVPKTPTANSDATAAAPVDEAPYEGWHKRNPFMMGIVWYCAGMFLFAIFGLTSWSIFDARRKKLPNEI